MNFTTPVEIKNPGFEISHNSVVLSVGSCFAENIAAKMLDNKFKILSNPSGVLYNPFSVGNCILNLSEKKPYSNADLDFFSELYFHFDFHGSYSSTNKEDCLHKIQNSCDEASAWLEKTSILIVTFGTSWVFEHKQTGKIVANCHKLPADQFTRRRLQPDEIVLFWQKLIKRLNENNPELKIIFTVSPVRHFKDGAFENQLSKAGLFVAVNELVHSNTNCFYFPAYEIMMDELRDYRFYASDMLHPSEQAIDYIWEKFAQCHFTNETLKLVNKIESIVRAVKHRPFNTETNGHKLFCKKGMGDIAEIESQNSNLDFTGEKEILKRFL